jgi:release factor glutamine methyltransferase
VTFSADDAEAALLEAEIPFVRLLGARVEPGVRLLLVRRRTARAAEQVLEATGWRYRAGHRGRHRFAGQAVFTWDGGATVALFSGIPAAPLPARALAGLEDRVWRGARPAQDGILEPTHLDALLVAAVQVVRPGFPRPLWRRQFVWLTGQEHDPAEAEATARDVGVAASLQRARRLVGTQPHARKSRRTLREHLWSAGRRLHQAAGSRRITALLDGAPIPGHAVFRTRFAGIEVDSGEGVFLPVPFSETLLRAGLERIAGISGPTVIDVGTGCGAVALALASARGDADVRGVDVSRRALRWARRNARRLELQNVRFQRGSLLEPVSGDLRGHVDVVLTNVPYAPPAYRRASWDDMPGTVEGEGEDGLGLQRRLATDAHGVLRPGGWLVAQIALEQADAFRSELDAGGYVDHAIVAARAGDAVVVGRAR